MTSYAVYSGIMVGYPVCFIQWMSIATMIYKPMLHIVLPTIVALFSPFVHASIVNGDFSSGDFTAWSLDTDGFGGSSPDFQIENLAGNNVARIEADFWSTPGDSFSTPLDAVFIANTMFQALDLSVPADSDLVLSFDWEFGGQQAGFDEIFFVGLGDGSGDFFDADGNLGFLLEPTAYGSGSFSAALAPSFFNAVGWTVEFQVGAGFDAFGSFARIDNVSLSAVPRQNVPIPGTLFLLGMGVAGIFSQLRCSGRQKK